MKLLLTSAGISNPSIRHALVDLLGKPIEEANALFVPTAIYGIRGGPQIVRNVIRTAKRHRPRLSESVIAL